MTTRNLILSFFIVGAHCFVSFAQNNGDYRIVDGSYLADYARLETYYHSAETEMIDDIFDSRANALLKAAEVFTRHIFSFSQLGFERAVTSRRTGSDCLIARWHIGKEGSTATMILRDTPYVSEYALRLGPRRIISREDLTAFLSEVLVRDRLPLRFVPERMTPLLRRHPPGINAFSVLIQSSEYRTIQNIFIDGATLGGEWLVQIRISKDFTESYYPVPPFVPERFPALSDLARSWTVDKIWSEVSKPQLDPEFPGYTFDRRDLILVMELLTRGLSAEQLTDLIVNGKTSNLYGHVGVVLQALQNLGKESSLTDSFGLVLGRFAPMGARADETVRLLFNYAAGHCSSQYESFALQTIKEQIFLGGALSYLGRCSHSNEVLQTISNLIVPESLASEKQFAMIHIQKRRSK